MRFPCPACAKELAIPDEKLPQVDRFIVNCPDCLEKLVIDKSSMANPVRLMHKPSPVQPLLEESPPLLDDEPEDFGVGVTGISHGTTTGISIVQEPVPPPEAEAMVGVTQVSADSPPPSVPEDIASDSVALAPAVPVEGALNRKYFPPGSKVVFSSWPTPDGFRGCGFFQEHGYHVSTAQDTTEATAKLRLNAYDIVLVEDSEDGRLLLREVGGWSGVRRRECNVALIGEGAGSLDPQSAFRWGVNSWLNKKDAGLCGDLLGEVLKGYDLYYELLRMAEQQGREE